MKLLVVGSTPDPKKENPFFTACFELGRVIGQSGYGVVLGSDRYTTADYHVMRGLRSVPGVHTIDIVRPLKEARSPRPDAVVGEGNAEQAPTGELRITYHPINGPWGVGRVTQLLKCDAVIAIGGGDGTRSVIEMAPELRVPVVAIPSFGGAASEYAPQLMRVFDTIGSSSNDYFALVHPWQTDHARTAVALATRLVRDNPYSDRFARYLLRLLGGVTLLFLSWVLFFVFPVGDQFGNNGSGNRITIFVLFWIAAFLGTALRAAKRVIDDPAARPSATTIMVDGTVGLGVSFGLSLLYMAGLFLASDNADIFPLVAEHKPAAVPDSPAAAAAAGCPAAATGAEGKFRRTAVLMSLISFAGAFLLESSLSRLDERLRERVLNEK